VYDLAVIKFHLKDGEASLKLFNEFLHLMDLRGVLEDKTIAAANQYVGLLSLGKSKAVDDSSTYFKRADTIF